MLSITELFVLLALVYPSGRMLSTRWRPLAAAGAFVIVFLSVGSAMSPWPAGVFPAQNPLGIAGALPDTASVLVALLAVAVVVLAVTSLVLRYRRAAGIERAVRFAWRRRICCAAVRPL